MEDETKKPKEPEEEKAPESARMVDDANLAAKRLEQANKVMTANIERQEALAAENALGGKSDAGETEVKKKEETPEEYSKRLFEGKANPLEDDGVV